MGEGEILLERGPVDLARRVLLGQDGEIRLTTKEAMLLSYLAERPGQDVPREELLAEVWGYRGGVVSRTADTTLQRLRAKVELDAAEPRHLLTVHGLGYRFEPLAEAPPPSPPPTLAPSNLSEDPGLFVGRRDELAHLIELLDGAARLVTLRGAGGTGKTRLSRHLGRALRPRGTFPGGVWFCDLTESRDAAHVLGVLGRVLDVPLGESRDLGDPAARLGHAIRARGPTLIILDNCEQVAAEGAALFSSWARGLPEARFVITSRESLRVEGETLVDLDPLPVDAGVALFVDRAERTRTGFVADEAVRGVLARIVRRLDGLPLAIELAAARVAVLSPPAILERLDDRFRLLASTRRDLPPRQRTLRGALDWSWDLLDGFERAALAQCSVFRGGFSFEAADAVLQVGAGATWSADLLQSLIDKSLVRSSEPPELPGTTHLALLESVRAYASERLDEAGEREATEARHRDHHLAAGQLLVTDIDGPDGIVVLRRLALDADNLDAIWQRERGRDPASACAAALLLHEVLRVRGPASRLLELLDGAVAISEELPPRTRMDLRIARARAERHVGRLDSARTDAAEAEALAQGLGDEAQGEALLARGLVESAAGELEAACDTFRESQARFEACGSVFGVLRARSLLAFDLWQRGRRHEADPILRAAVAEVERLGLHHQAAKMLSTQGLILGQEGLWEEALERLEKSREGHLALGDRRGEGIVLANIASLHSSQGRLVEAEAVYRQALAAQRAVGEVRLEGVILRNIGVVLLGQGRDREAEGWFAEALVRNREAHDRFSEGRVLADLAEIHVLRGQLVEADALYEQALAVTEAAGDERYATYIRGNVALRHYLAGDLDRAEAELAPTLERLLEVAGPRPLGYYLAFAGALAGERGEHDLARERLASSRERLEPTGDPPGLGTLAICELIARRARGEHRGDAVAEAEAAIADVGAPRHAHAIEQAMLLLGGGLPNPG